MVLRNARSKHILWLLIACIVLVLILIGIFPTRVEREPGERVTPEPPAALPDNSFVTPPTELLGDGILASQGLSYSRCCRRG